jgi:hypothetical protein
MSTARYDGVYGKGGISKWGHYHDADKMSFIRDSRSYGGETGEKYEKDIERVKDLLKGRDENISLTALRKARVYDSTLIDTLIPSGEFENEEQRKAFREGRQKALDLYQKISDQQKALNAVEEERKALGITENYNPERELKNKIRAAQRDALKEAMQEAGVEFNNISVEDFGRRLVYSSGKAVATNKGESYRGLTEAFQFIPKKTLEQLKAWLDSNNKSLQILAGAKRGHFTAAAYVRGVGRTGPQIVLSEDSRSLGGDSKYTDVALHELFHFIEHVNPQLGALQHAWLYDRAKKVDDRGQEYVPGVYSIGKGEYSIPTEGMAASYTGRVYSEDSVPLSPENKHYEIMTTGVQMFTSPNTYDRTEEGRDVLLVRDGKRVDRLRIGKDAYYNPDDGKWYKDSAFSIPIKPDRIMATLGTGGKRDDQFRAFVLGAMIGLS